MLTFLPPTEDIALFILRMALVYIYLLPAVMMISDPSRLQRTIVRTGILFQDSSSPMVRVAAWAGIGIMGLGGLALLLGVFVVEACLLLIVFTILGAMVHNRELAQALQKIDGWISGLGNESPHPGGEVRASLIEGHRSTAKKNWGLVGILLFLVLTKDPVGQIGVLSLL
ncbi:MAG: hypothetical protein ACR2OW_10365 [Methyloligellaceae bacterium]